MIVILVGESGSGKTTLANNLELQGFNKIVTYTTRPPRQGELEGIDYHFVSDKQFEEMIAKNMFVEYNEYRGWKYGVSANFQCNNDMIAVLTPAGARAFKKYANNHPELQLDLLVIYLWVDRRSRLIQLLNRGDNIEEAYRRSLSDVGQFDAFDKEADLVLKNERYYLNPDTLCRLAANLIKRRKDEQNI